MAEKESQPQKVSQKQSPDQSSVTDEGKFGYLPVKSIWPEVVGLTGEEAESKIKEDVPEENHIFVVQPDSFLTMDIRTDRVRIFIDSSGKVSKPPRIG